MPLKLSSRVCPKGILKSGSVKKTEPSDLTTMSFGLLNLFPLYVDASDVIVPSSSCRATRRRRICVNTSRPCRSNVMPFELSEGCNQGLTEPSNGDQTSMRLRLMSLNRSPAPSFQSGPSGCNSPVASFSNFASGGIGDCPYSTEEHTTRSARESTCRM